MEMKWSKLENRYDYLSREDSDLYDKYKNATDEKGLLIKNMLEDKARASRANQAACKY